jgi:acetyl esterase/lipase
MKNGTAASFPPDDGSGQLNEDEMYAYISENDSVLDIVNHPAFNGFGRFILPSENGLYDRNMQLKNINSLLPYHNHITPDTTVQVINHMIDDINDGKTIFYDFYTEQQKQKDHTKKSTGLFFFRGKPGAPFAIICPGGGFAYVGSIHEGFPHAVELSDKGYNAFVLKYRVGDEVRATEDLAAAMSYIFENAETLEVGTKDYSLWGGSAGARMVANIGSNGAVSFGGNNLPKPSVIVMAYTGHSSFSKNDPPTFVTVSEDDRIVNIQIVEQRVGAVRNAGIDVEYRKYQYAGHGFGLGIGTDAEGWIEHAIRFWERHISQ